LRRSILEGQLAERLELSRTPVRQALTMLEAEGLVDIAPNKRAVVCSFSIEDIWDIYDLHAVLEGHAARRVAARIRAGEFTRLREVAEAMEEVSPERFADYQEESRWLVATNQEFHGTIVTASRNGRLENFIRRTVEVPLMFRNFFRYGERAVSNHYHRQILKALEEGDGERAEIIMPEHVYEGRDFVIGAHEEEMR